MQLLIVNTAAKIKKDQCINLKKLFSTNAKFQTLFCLLDCI